MTASPDPVERAVPDVTLEQLVSRSRRNFRTVEDMVASVIRNAIGAGIFKPGERLPQDRLAKLLEVSRMPIRAALRQLESEGLVELHPHRGASVRALSGQEIADLYEMRILIETFALRKTAAAIDEAQLAELDELAGVLDRSASAEEWLERRQVFYRRLYSIGNTPRVVSTIMQFRSEVSRYTVDLRNLRSETHRELLDQLRLRDPDLAAVWLEAHLRQVARALRQQVVPADEA
jgi:DNA-binding GntR family transcriptional regulator